MITSFQKFWLKQDGCRVPGARALAAQRERLHGVKVHGDTCPPRMTLSLHDPLGLWRQAKNHYMFMHEGTGK